MQITLNQAELKDAVRSYLRSNRIDSDNIDMSFTATRGGAGIVTTITLGAEVCDEARLDVKVDAAVAEATDHLDTNPEDDTQDTNEEVVEDTSTTKDDDCQPEATDTGADLGTNSNSGASDKLFG